MVFHELSDSIYNKSRRELIPYTYKKECFIACDSFYLYFLLDEGEIVYIGQTTLYPTARVRQHVSTNKKFDSVVPFIINDCKSKEDLRDLEAYLIMRHKPRYNQSLPKCKWLCKPMQLRKIAKTCNIPFSVFVDIRKNSKLKSYMVEFRGNVFFDCKKFSDDFTNNKII